MIESYWTNLTSVHSIVQVVYFPVSEAPDDQVKESYYQLEQLLETLPNGEIAMPIEDYNVQVGREPRDR